jgi:beta-glucosidase
MGKSWGVEKLSIAERHYKVLMAGVDQFGGNNDAGPVLEAYAMGVKEHGETFMRKRFEASAVRLLLNIFRVGLFENPYLNPEESKKIVGQPDFMKAGYDAQLKSIVLLKNKQKTLPLSKGKTSRSASYPDLTTILDTKKAMKGKPVIVCISINNPMVFA